MFHLRALLCSYLVYKIRAKTSLVALNLKRIPLLQLQIRYCLQGFKFAQVYNSPTLLLLLFVFSSNQITKWMPHRMLAGWPHFCSMLGWVYLVVVCWA